MATKLGPRMTSNGAAATRNGASGILPAQPDGWVRLAMRATRRLPRMRGAGRLMVAVLSVYAVGVHASRLLPWRRPRPEALVSADVLGFRMRLNPYDFVDAALLFFPQVYEWREIDFLERHLRPGDVFIDGGAHLGFFSVVASRLVGASGTVIAVEPDPEMHARLVETLRDNGAGNVNAVQAGLSDRRRTLRLGVAEPPLRGASSFFLNTPGGVAVPCLPLLDLLRERNVHAVRALKLDIEGFEYRVLNEFLRHAPRELMPDFVIVEVGDLVEKLGDDPVTLLRSHGYRVHQKTWLNYVMVRGDLSGSRSPLDGQDGEAAG